MVNDVKYISATAICVLAVLFASCSKKKAALPKPVRPVTVAQAAARDVPLYLDEIGTATAYETVQIQAQVTGPMIGIHFTDGAEVKKGDLLFTIDPRPFQTALKRATATLEQDRSKAQNDEVQFKRNEELRRDKVIAAQEFDAARTTAQGSAAAVQAAEAAVQTAQINLEHCSIRSPIDGRTSKRSVDAGNVVVANSTHLLLIQRQDPIYVDFTIPEGALPRVRKFKEEGSLKVEASFADDPEKRRIGELNFLDSGVQQSSGTVRLRAVLDNDDRLFWPGQFVNVRLLLDTIKAAVLVPNEAMQIGNNGPFVFVVNQDSTVELRPVKPGQRQGDDVVLAEGIQPGETVVVTGQLALAPGAQVAVVPASEPSPKGGKLSQK